MAFAILQPEGALVLETSFDEIAKVRSFFSRQDLAGFALSY
jgi:hypothetical protein